MQALSDRGSHRRFQNRLRQPWKPRDQGKQCWGGGGVSPRERPQRSGGEGQGCREGPDWVVLQAQDAGVGAF